MTTDFQLNCPAPHPPGATIKLAHGGGGRLMQDLIKNVFARAFDNPDLNTDCDAATFSPVANRRLAFTTDAFVVRPLFFPGGDIGTLAVNGTVNDLAMSGARPLYLSAAFIIEEGLAIADLERIATSMRETANRAGVHIITGDTKVVDRGKGDGVFITTSGVGTLEHDGHIAPSAVQAGDAILLSGDVGRHGMAIMAVREGLEFESSIESDCAPLAAPILDLLANECAPHMMRDCTRGGLASALVEIAQSAGCRARIDADAIPVNEQVRAACEILGMDPLYVANEGCMVIILPADQADRALEILRRHPETAQACRIGEIIEARSPGRVCLRNTLGVDRVLDLLSGEQLPRIC